MSLVFSWAWCKNHEISLIWRSSSWMRGSCAVQTPSLRSVSLCWMSLASLSLGSGRSSSHSSSCCCCGARRLYCCCWQSWRSQSSCFWRCAQLFSATSLPLRSSLTACSWTFSFSLRAITSSFILLQQALYSSLTSLAFSSSRESSLISRLRALSSERRMLRGDLSSSFLSSSASTLSRAFSARILASSTSTCAFSLMTVVLSSLCLRFSVSISWSLARHYRETSVILVCSSCSKVSSFCSRLLSSASLARSLPSRRVRAASTFLNCFSFSRSLLRCCSLTLVQNSISFCLSVNRAFASSAFFHVSNSHTTFRSNQFSPAGSAGTAAPTAPASSCGRSSTSYRNSRMLKPRSSSCPTGPRSSRQAITRRLPMLRVLPSAPSSIGRQASRTRAQLSEVVLRGISRSFWSSRVTLPSCVSALRRSVCHSSTSRLCVSRVLISAAEAWKYPLWKQF